jgi:hypothetical protein
MAPAELFISPTGLGTAPGRGGMSPAGLVLAGICMSSAGLGMTPAGRSVSPEELPVKGALLGNFY